MKAAKNVDQVYAFLNYLHTPEASAAVAEGSGYNPVVTGADALALRRCQEELPGSLSRRRAEEPVALARRSRHGMPKSAPSTPTSSRLPDLSTFKHRIQPRSNPGLVFLRDLLSST